jgi:hypothetical protein
MTPTNEFSDQWQADCAAGSSNKDPHGRALYLDFSFLLLRCLNYAETAITLIVGVSKFCADCKRLDSLVICEPSARWILLENSASAA